MRKGLGSIGSARALTTGVAMLALVASAPATAAEHQTLKVAAAADLEFAFKEIGAVFEQQTGTRVAFSFGPTGLLARQIMEGAAFDVFAAANIAFVDDVVKAGVCDGRSVEVYARGHIVVWWPKTRVADPPRAFSDLADASFAKIAIANPEHAPYGIAAQQALQSSGLWELMKPKLVYGENVLQALQFAQTGNADAAIVALSLATVASEGTFLQIPQDQHQPIDQALVVCGKEPRVELGRRFAKFMNSDRGRAIMRRYGFLLSGDLPGRVN